MLHLNESSTHLDPAILADLRALNAPGEDIFAELVAIFLDEVPAQLSALTAAMAARDVQSVWQIAHRLKGTALGMGASRMADICAALEVAGRERALDRAVAHAQALRAEFELTRIAVEQTVGPDSIR